MWTANNAMGVWTPEKLNATRWAPDRSLNSLELLSFVKLAYTLPVTEYQYYLKLINEEKYLENMSRIPQQNPAWFNTLM